MWLDSLGSLGLLIIVSAIAVNSAPIHKAMTEALISLGHWFSKKELSILLNLKVSLPVYTCLDENHSLKKKGKEKKKKTGLYFYVLRLSKILCIYNSYGIVCVCAHVYMGSHTGCLCMHTSPYIWMPKQVCTWHHVYREVTGQLSEVWFLLLRWDAGTQVWWQSSLSDMLFLTQWTIPRTRVLHWLVVSFQPWAPFLFILDFQIFLFFDIKPLYHYPDIEPQKTENQKWKWRTVEKLSQFFF